MRIRGLVWTVVAAAVSWTACASRVERTVTGDDQATAQIRQSTTLLGNDEALLDRARTASQAGDYEAAAAAYTELYNSSKKTDRRAQALFLRAGVQANLLNPRRDVAAAIASYEQLVREFPASRYRDDAEDAMAKLQAAGK